MQRVVHHLCLAVATFTVAMTFEALMTGAAPHADASECATHTGDELLTATFGEGLVELTGADYQRSLGLPDGRTLWTFQDAFVARPGRTDRLVHNVGVIQDGACFSLLRSGTDSEPRPWIAADDTQRFHHWFWPLGGTVAPDSTVQLYVAELRERGPRYLSHTEPVATWLATLDPQTLHVVDFRLAPNSGADLYGWSVATDATFNYLYSHCYRQFGFSPVGHDPCTADLKVARVERADAGAPMTYWDGVDWVGNPDAAANIAPRTGVDGAPRAITPMQVQHLAGQWIAVTKDGDWWGSKIYLDRAPGPEGPWTSVAALDATTLGPGDVFNTYFASFGPLHGDDVIIGLSNNRWDGRQSDEYRPTFTRVPIAMWQPICHPLELSRR